MDGPLISGRTLASLSTATLDFFRLNLNSIIKVILPPDCWPFIRIMRC